MENSADLTECYGCGKEFPEAEAEWFCTYRQTLETPAEHEPICPDCVERSQEVNR